MTIAWEFDPSRGLLGPGLGLAVRSTILLAIALAAWRALGRRRPALGSAIAHAGLIGLILLPASARFGPPLPIPLRASEPAPALPVVVPSAEEPRPRPFDGPAAPEDGPPLRASAPAVPALPALAPAERPAPLAEPAPAWRPVVDVALLVVALYAAVALVLIARLVGSLAGVVRLRRSAVPVDEPAWLDALDRHRRQFGIARPVALARSARVGVPVVVGWLRPAILLPAHEGAGDITGHADAILLHELAHVRRGDYAWNVLLRLVQAAYWPHPLAWMLGRAMAESRELACDAFCVHRMGGPAPYRAALLAMAEGLARPAPALGMAMASRSRLGRRVAEIDRGRGEPRCLPRWPARAAIAALALALAAAVGPARITRAEPRPAPAPTPVAMPQEPKQAADPARAPGAGRVFRLRVVAAETGKPVPRADVRVWMKLGGDDWRRADDEGRLDITYDTGPDDRHFGVDVWGDGFAMQRHNWGDDPKVTIPDEATIRLHPGESLGGMVRDEEGRPIAGAVVYLWSHNYKKQDPAELLFDLRATTGPDGRWHTGGAPQTTGELLGFYITHPDFVSDREYVAGREKPPIEALRAGRAESTMVKGVPIEGRILAADGRPVAGALVISTEQPFNLFNDVEPFAVRSDAEGRFRTGQVKPGTWHLVVRAPGHAPAARSVKVGTAVPAEEIRLDPPHTFRARVVTPDGKPIEGAFVNIDTWDRYRCLGVYLYTDADGWARWDDAPAGDLVVGISRRGYLGAYQQKARVGEDLTATLRPSLSISGRVLDAETKRKIEQARIEFGAVDPATGGVARWQEAPSPGPSMVFEGTLSVQIGVEADAYKIRITAGGYEPFVSRTFRRDEPVVLGYDVALAPGRAAGPLATAVRPDGRPLAGARIVQARPNGDINLQDGRTGNEGDDGRQAATAADGTFAIPQGDRPALILILGDDCFAYANTKALAASPRLEARPYGRVEGRYVVGTRPLAGREIELSGHIQDDSTSNTVFSYGQKARTDAEGRFAFAKVIPMANLRISRSDRLDGPGSLWTLGQPVRVEDGRTTTVTVGGTGRPVVGRVDRPDGWTQPIDFTDRARASLESDRAHDPFPMELLRGKTSLNETGWSEWMRAWRKSPEGRAYNYGRVLTWIALAPDGSFRFDDVPPGEYRLSIRVNDEAFRGERGPFAPLAWTVAVPPIPGGRSDEPLDLGTKRLRTRARPEVGQPAPPFEVATADGRKLAVPGDFAGKFLLLDFGTMRDSQSRLQVVRMNDVFARFGKDERFRLLSLMFAADRPDSRDFVADKGQPWPQAIVGPIASPIADAYGVAEDNFPAAILVGPDGRIAARDLQYEGIGEAIAGALGIREPAAKP